MEQFLLHEVYQCRTGELVRIQYLLLIIEFVLVCVDGVGEREVLRVPERTSVLHRESRLLPVCGREWAYVWV